MHKSLIHSAVLNWFASLEILNVWNDMVHWNKPMPLISMQVFLLFEPLDLLTNHQLLFSQLTMMRCHSMVDYLFIYNQGKFTCRV
jgi:hypothetical protein